MKIQIHAYIFYLDFGGVLLTEHIFYSFIYVNSVEQQLHNILFTQNFCYFIITVFNIFVLTFLDQTPFCFLCVLLSFSTNKKNLNFI